MPLLRAVNREAELLRNTCCCLRLFVLPPNRGRLKIGVVEAAMEDVEEEEEVGMRSVERLGLGTTKHGARGEVC